MFYPERYVCNPIREFGLIESPTRTERPYVGTGPASVSNRPTRTNRADAKILLYGRQTELEWESDRHGVCPYMRALLARIGIRPRCDLSAEAWILDSESFPRGLSLRATYRPHRSQCEAKGRKCLA